MDQINFEKILDLHKIGVLKVDNDKIILDTNDTFCDLSLYERAFLIGKVATDFLMREMDISIMDAEVERRLLGKSTSGELWFVKADGNEVLSKATAVPYTLENGETGGSYILLQDITKFNRDAIELRQLNENLPGMIFRANSDWKTLYVTNAKKICGYKNEELISGKVPWKGIIYPPDQQRVFDEALAIAEYPAHSDMTYRIRTKNGNIKWVTEQKSKHPNGEITGLVYEDSVSASKAKVFEDNVSGIFKASHKCFLEANHSFARMFGYTQKEILNQPTDIIFFTTEERDACFMTCMNEQIVDNHKVRLRKKDGSEVWVSLNARMQSDTELQGTMIDITMQISAEKKIDVKRLKNQFVILLAQEEERQRISRDIHDSVGQMLIGIRLLFEEKMRNMEPALKAGFNEIDHHLDSVIKETRMLVNKFGIALTLNNSVKSAYSEVLYKSKSFYKGQIHFSWTGNDAMASSNNALHAFRIFQEAVTNVFKYGEADNLEVTVDNSTDFVLIIKDDGAGYDQTKKSEGFGLRNMAERVEAIEGQLTIISSPGEGTEVKLIIPGNLA
jgi:PAS domain S-box-containing protein